MVICKKFYYDSLKEAAEKKKQNCLCHHNNTLKGFKCLNALLCCRGLAKRQPRLNAHLLHVSFLHWIAHPVPHDQCMCAFKNVDEAQEIGKILPNENWCKIKNAFTQYKEIRINVKGNIPYAYIIMKKSPI